MPRVYLSIGSNIERERSIRGALRALHEQYGELILSTLYENEAVGFEGAPFYNLVVAFDTTEAWQLIQQKLRRIEEDFGRVRGEHKFSARTLDIDLLLYGDLDLHDQGVDLPRDEILKYAFVLGPLAELAGRECHPQTGKRIDQHWDEFDQSGQPPLSAVDLQF